MKRNRQKRRGGIGRDTEHLIWLATGLAESGSLAEDRWWDRQLVETVDGLLAEHDEEALNVALDGCAP